MFSWFEENMNTLSVLPAQVLNENCVGWKSQFMRKLIKVSVFNRTYQEKRVRIKNCSPKATRWEFTFEKKKKRFWFPFILQTSKHCFWPNVVRWGEVRYRGCVFFSKSILMADLRPESNFSKWQVSCIMPRCPPRKECILFQKLQIQVR